MDPAFTPSLPLRANHAQGRSHTTTKCKRQSRHRIAIRSTRMSAQTPSTWPPADMTDEWAYAVERLSRAVPAVTLVQADDALSSADGDEQVALANLVQTFASPVQKQREQAVKKARDNGDVNRVSAMKEAEMRRKATGSANDFFKGYVEIEGSYVDQGYVDEQADVMAKARKAFDKLFGRDQ